MIYQSLTNSINISKLNTTNLETWKRSYFIIVATYIARFSSIKPKNS